MLVLLGFSHGILDTNLYSLAAFRVEKGLRQAAGYLMTVSTVAGMVYCIGIGLASMTQTGILK